MLQLVGADDNNLLFYLALSFQSPDKLKHIGPLVEVLICPAPERLAKVFTPTE